MIRNLSIDEVGLMVEGGKRFFEEGKLPGRFNPEHFVQKWKEYIPSGIGEAYGMFDESTGGLVGALGALFYKCLLTGDDMSSEVFWFVFPEHRGRGMGLLDRYVDRACKRRCKRIYMVHLESLHPEALKKLYERKGFRMVETGYLKEVPWQ